MKRRRRFLFELIASTSLVTGLKFAYYKTISRIRGVQDIQATEVLSIAHEEHSRHARNLANEIASSSVTCCYVRAMENPDLQQPLLLRREYEDFLVKMILEKFPLAHTCTRTYLRADAPETLFQNPQN